jgi:hypothetical protein
MGVAQVAIIILVGLATAFGAAYLLSDGHLFDGCLVHLESEATHAVGYAVDYQGKPGVASGTLPPGGKADARLCRLSPRDSPEATVRVEGVGQMSVKLDPYCDDWRLLVNDTAIVAGSRACE